MNSSAWEYNLSFHKTTKVPKAIRLKLPLVHGYLTHNLSSARNYKYISEEFTKYYTLIKTDLF